MGIANCNDEIEFDEAVYSDEGQGTIDNREKRNHERYEGNNSDHPED
jgi:hypothetical protein